jgi:hypothetical protein
MAQILFLSTHEEECKIHALNIYIKLGADVIIKNKYQEAVQLLSVHPQIDVVVLDVRDSEFLALPAHLDANARFIPIIKLCQAGKQDTQHHIYEYSLDTRPIIDSCIKLLRIKEQPLHIIDGGDFFPIPMNYFDVNLVGPFDLYLPLKRKEGDKMLKRYSKGDKIELTELLRYKNYGVSNLFVKTEDRKEYINSFSIKIADAVQRAELGSAQQSKMIEQSMSFLGENIEELGAVPELVNLGKTCIDTMVLVAARHQKIKGLLGNLLKNTSGYSYTHGQMLIFLFYKLSKRHTWLNDEVVNKLAFVAFFHDIVLSEEEHVKIRNDIELESLEYPERVTLLVRKHASITAKYINEAGISIPMDCENIIRQHHGDLRGESLPVKPSLSISPLAILFLLAENFVEQFLVDQNEKEAFHYVSKTYSPLGAKYKDMVEKLEKLLNDVGSEA